MSDQATSGLHLPVKCKLCPQSFMMPPNAPGIGGQPSEEFRNFALKVSSHVAKKHGDRTQWNMAMLNMLDSYLVLSLFVIQGDFARQVDLMRHQLHRATRAVKVTDVKLMERVLALALLSTADQEKVLALLTEMRDMYEERGLHPEVEAAEAAAAQAQNPGSSTNEAPPA